ncbi:hypothetical protein LTS08_003262 [Lithohypha guttulata]|uniref:OTU domain-containing protein n=1 Tax=Lithohypha guttulata TaxID=1690604 RepID=A0AAN7YG37_9EURO|nr:hypothetical protein LTR05_004558 [Lithohypha guttulata]KAK5103840.1 hypothetical protein LTS08_003262 [Lithohypha guttulata]
MANDAASLQLPIMVRQPKMVWPGLDKEGLHLKSIAGDGNCLFASLSDQLYGSPSRHGEIRATIVDHMRTFRPLYEGFLHADDVVQKRATRATTESIRKHMEDDAFEGYLTAMSRLGTYGGQPELLAFVRAYDQDVIVHLPPSMGWDTSILSYTNEDRAPEVEPPPSLHICYGGDEEKHAHYDSSQKSEADSQRRSLASRPKPYNRQNVPAVQQNHDLSSRALRNMKSDPHKDMMHELVTRGTKDLRSGLDLLNDQRARSPSVTSSHYSTSSKRSFEDDGELPRSTKRTDRKKRTLRSRAAARQLSGSPNLHVSVHVSQPTSSGPPTPASSQDTDSSDQAERVRSGLDNSAASSPKEIEVINLIDDDDDSDHQVAPARTQPFTPTPRRQASVSSRSDLASKIPSIIKEAPRSTLQA